MPKYMNPLKVTNNGMQHVIKVKRNKVFGSVQNNSLSCGNTRLHALLLLHALSFLFLWINVKRA